MAMQETNASDIDTSRMYTVKEVASYLRFSTTYVRDLIREGRIKGVKPTGGQIRIPGAEVVRVVGGVQREGSVPQPQENDDVDTIDVPLENADRIFPPSATPEPKAEELKVGFHHLFDEKPEE